MIPIKIPLRFQRKMWKIGASWVFTIPKSLVENLDKDQEYTIEIKEVEK